MNLSTTIYSRTYTPFTWDKVLAWTTSFKLIQHHSKFKFLRSQFQISHFKVWKSTDLLGMIPFSSPHCPITFKFFNTTKSNQTWHTISNKKREVLHSTCWMVAAVQVSNAQWVLSALSRVGVGVAALSSSLPVYSWGSFFVGFLLETASAFVVRLFYVFMFLLFMLTDVGYVCGRRFVI